MAADAAGLCSCAHEAACLQHLQKTTSGGAFSELFPAFCGSSVLFRLFLCVVDQHVLAAQTPLLCCVEVAASAPLWVCTYFVLVQLWLWCCCSCRFLGVGRFSICYECSFTHCTALRCVEHCRSALVHCIPPHVRLRCSYSAAFVNCSTVCQGCTAVDIVLQHNGFLWQCTRSRLCQQFCVPRSFLLFPRHFPSAMHLTCTCTSKLWLQSTAGLHFALW